MSSTAWVAGSTVCVHCFVLIFAIGFSVMGGYGISAAVTYSHVDELPLETCTFGPNATYVCESDNHCVVATTVETTGEDLLVQWPSINWMIKSETSMDNWVRKMKRGPAGCYIDAEGLGFQENNGLVMAILFCIFGIPSFCSVCSIIVSCVVSLLATFD